MLHGLVLRFVLHSGLEPWSLRLQGKEEAIWTRRRKDSAERTEPGIQLEELTSRARQRGSLCRRWSCGPQGQVRTLQKGQARESRTLVPWLSLATLKTYFLGAGEMAQSINHLPHKNKVSSSAPSLWIKSQEWWGKLVIPEKVR